MKFRYFVSSVMLAVFTASFALAQEDAAPDIDWLSGVWISEEAGRISEESWSQDRGEVMFGLNISIRDGRVSGFEYLRIEWRGDQWVYIAQPGGGPPTEFVLDESGPMRASFINPGHDFPQRITYHRDGDTLTAEVSDLSGEEGFVLRWTLKK